jgi:hypothetical protein
MGTCKKKNSHQTGESLQKKVLPKVPRTYQEGSND